MKNFFIIIALLCIIGTSCKKETINDPPADLPIITDTLSGITMEFNYAEKSDSMYGYRYIKVKNHITNTSATTNYTWEIISNSSTTNLSLLICDPATCMPPNTLVSSFNLAKDSTGIFEVGLMNTNYSATVETRLIEKITIKVLIYPTGKKEDAITYTAVINCV